MLTCSLFLSRAEAGPATTRSPDEVLLVVNLNSPVSQAIAGDYAYKRKIKNVLSVQCQDSALSAQNETMTLADYTRSIENPIHGYLATHANIAFIVLTKGMPIRIAGAAMGSCDEHSREPAGIRGHPSVDSFLAALDYPNLPGTMKIDITGSGAIGCAYSNRYWNATEPFSHSKFGGYLVTRLDGYTEADARALVSQSLEAERGLTHGTMLFDVQPIFGLGDKAAQPAPAVDKIILRESPWSEYNADMRGAHDLLMSRGIPAELDLTPTFIGGRSNLLGYFSSGSNDPRYSREAYQMLFFAPGSLSDTAVSTSARTFLPTKGGQSLLVDLIAHGLTCGKGYVNEPLLQATASPTIVLERYTSGYTMAESFYAASRFVAWEDVIIGDPLCCPYAKSDYQFDGTISRQVLENYLARSITMEGLLNGRGNFDDNIRMLKSTGAKYFGRALCLWGAEANFLHDVERAREEIPQVLAADPEIILEACVFETVSPRVNQIAVPDWVFTAFGQPMEHRNFRYDDMIYPDGQRRPMGRNAQVPDESRLETQLWFFYQAASYIDIGCQAIHFGQVEIMNKNDRDNAHWENLLTLVRAYAAQHARHHMVLCNGHVPSGGLMRNGHPLLDFHAFPLRVMEQPDKPQEAILKAGFSDGIYGRSKGGPTFSGWTCEHLPYLVELDNWGVSKQPGQPKAGGNWIWGYDEITWFAHQTKSYRSDWLRYAWDWVRKTDTNGYLEMPGSRTETSPLDHKRWYFANTPSPAVPDGLGDQEAIRAIWAANPPSRRKTNHGPAF